MPARVVTHTEYVARTAAGLPIRFFADEAQAQAWMKSDAPERFPGWTLRKETTRTSLSVTEIARDEREEAA